MGIFRKKVVIAAGGTGGHLFPAQAIAEKMIAEDPKIALIFAGAQLKRSAYFDSSRFPFQEIRSAPFLSGGWLGKCRSACRLLRGIIESIQLLSREAPDVVVGFGSYHTFPILCAAVLKRIPLILFESNVVPGRVVRLFSKPALVTGVYFPETARYLKGKSEPVVFPSNRSRVIYSPEDARRYFHLIPEKPTLLVFGGSQGAKGINQAIFKLFPLLLEKGLDFQLVHMTGDDETALKIQQYCECHAIPVYARKFEERMDLAWSAADLALCRAGAATLSELIHFETPAFLVPYPYATEQHQLKNGEFLEKNTGGVRVFEEKHLNIEELAQIIYGCLSFESNQLKEMKEGICRFKEVRERKDLVELILSCLIGGSHS